jgi:opacity protein-like surface antigen
VVRTGPLIRIGLSSLIIRHFQALPKDRNDSANGHALWHTLTILSVDSSLEDLSRLSERDLNVPRIHFLMLIVAFSVTNLAAAETDDRNQIDLMSAFAPVAPWFNISEGCSCSQCLHAAECSSASHGWWSDRIADSCIKPYISGQIGASIMHGEAGGFNTEGLFANTGSETGTELSLGGAIGFEVPQEFGTLRLEAEGRWRDNVDIQTDSFSPPAPFIYDINVSDSWSTMGNAWFDIPIDDCRDVYFGGGLGVAGQRVSVFDGVVQGSGSGTDLAWQVGAGLNYHLTERVTLDFGYRYADLGDVDVNLSTVAFNTAAGNYTLDVESHEFMMTVRITGW